ncbi:hypothetical protein C8A05DRAFT_39357 [Staphylotrichum tortipilum]|uniref:Mediator complex subunit 15 KIX domain-containing protein n=1 Tax=Staphylotrichum tortipilum TaxID=2831512 RepID=A0AAN6RNL4_9PEZI|nr:hypothetical protein C8A05DRAFT_39357 [Staphylotrichum longicolle]
MTDSFEDEDEDARSQISRNSLDSQHLQGSMQATQQRQQQMMLSHPAARGGMAKPGGPHGFPAGMQNQIPVSGMPQQPQSVIDQLVYSHLMQAPAAPRNTWQSTVSQGDRFSKAIGLVSNSILAYPGNDWQEICSSAMDLERKQFLSAPDKQSYDHAMFQKTMEMVKKRQGRMQNRPDPRGFPMGVGRPPGPQPGFWADPLSRLSPQDQARVNELAVSLMARANEQQLNQIRAAMMQQLTPAQRGEYTNQRKDPAILYYQNTALRELQNRAAAAAARMRNMMPQRQGGMPGAGVPPGQMNPAALLGGLGLQPGILDGQVFIPNMESIRNEQQMAQMAQKSGQVVVPASITPGRNATPGPMAGLPQQGNQQGPNQTPRPPQGQQPFGTPQQPGVRAVGGRPMPGQPGAMNTPNVPPQASSISAMNTPTAPMQQPPVSMGQGNATQAMNQGNPPMTAPLNPQFNHQNNTRPPSMPGNMNNHAAMAGMMANLPPEARANMVNAMQQQQQQQQDTNSRREFREFYAKLSMQGLKPGMMPGMPGQLQGGQMNGMNQAAMANANQKNPAMQGAG